MEFDTKTREYAQQCLQCKHTDCGIYSSLPDFGQDIICVHFCARPLACYSCTYLLGLLCLFLRRSCSVWIVALGVPGAGSTSWIACVLLSGVSLDFSQQLSFDIYDLSDPLRLL